MTDDKMKARVLIMQPEIFCNGGAERQIAFLANYLVTHDYPVTILTTTAVEDFIDSLHIDVNLIQAVNYENMKNVYNAIESYYQVINPHNHPIELFVNKNSNVIWQCNEPPISVLRGGDLEPEQVEFVNRAVDKVFVITDFEKNRFKEVYGMEAEVNYPGITFFPDQNKDFEVCDEFDLIGKFVILQTGMLTFTKNQVKSVEIFAEVKQDIEDAVLVLAGHDDSDYKWEVLQKIQELGLEDDVIMTGFLPEDEQIRDLYAVASVHIAPVDSQGGWMTSFQASMMGVPSIVSLQFTARKLAEEKELCFVEDVDDFADKIIDIHDNYIEYAKIANRHGKNVLNALSWDKFCENYAKAIDELYSERDHEDEDCPWLIENQKGVMCENCNSCDNNK